MDMLQWHLRCVYNGFLFFGNDTAYSVDQNGNVLVIGGYQSASPYYLKDAWQSTNSGSSWTMQTDSAAWVGRCYHAAAVLEVSDLFPEYRRFRARNPCSSRRMVTLSLPGVILEQLFGTCGGQPTAGHRGLK